ncbi:FGGY family carbohydrate kinase [Cohnella sp. REN36]|uniref:sedoheptulokinase n=1 Tax=Cohnella sp. REN36 TaxID=2887347 RepID=UPI001D136919|nr:sugar kinase [Cohnella sp. REN36]
MTETAPVYTIGIDIGTTSLGLVAADANDGRTVYAADAPNGADVPARRADERLQHPDRIVRAVRDLLNACPGDVLARVAAIGVSSQMHGMLYVDAGGRAVSPLYTWQDARGERKLSDGRTHVGRLREETGYPLSAGYGLVTHAVLAHSGEVPPEAAHLCTIGDYVAMRLCGLAAPRTDASHAAALGLFDLKVRAFDEAAVVRAGIDPRLLPDVAGPGEAALGRTEEGRIVACAVGDNQASFLGAVPALTGSLLLNVGTGAQTSAFTGDHVDVVGASGLELRPFPGGGYLLVGATLGGGKVYELLARFVAETCLAFAGTVPDRKSIYETLNRLALRALDEGLSLPRVNPSFYGTRAEPDRRGAIVGLGEANWSPQRLAAGFLAGLADELAAFRDAMPAPLRAAAQVAIGSGNGIRRNPALRRLLRDRLGMPVRLPAAGEEAAFGAAVHAAVAAGLYPDHEAALARMGQPLLTAAENEEADAGDRADRAADADRGK